jgi:hypothetical protein
MAPILGTTTTRMASSSATRAGTVPVNPTDALVGNLVIRFGHVLLKLIREIILMIKLNYFVD